MSMSTSVVGFVPPDEKFIKMKKAYDACKAAKIPIPKEVYEFFNDEAPDDNGVEINLEDNGFATVWNTESGSGFEVNLEELPKDIKIIRFFNSW